MAVTLRSVAACVVLRLKTVLLVAVAFLLAMNLVLPVRYTVKLVAVQQNLVPEPAYLERREPALQRPSEAVLAASTAVEVELAQKELTPGPARSAPRQPESDQFVEQEEGEEYDTFMSREDYVVSHEDPAEKPERIKSLSPAPPGLTAERDAAQATFLQEHRESQSEEKNQADQDQDEQKVALKRLEAKWQDAGFSKSEFKQVFGNMDESLKRQAMTDKAAHDRMHRDDVNERHRKEMMKRYYEKERRGEPRLPSARGVDFHDPVQRMAYYKKLKSKYAGAGMRMRRSEHAEHMKELINTLWGSWFDEDASMELQDFEQYVKADSTPSAIAEQLGRCAAGLGVPQSTLDSQQGDLHKSSIKLSAFLSAVNSLVPNKFSAEYSSPCWNTDKINWQSHLFGMLLRVMGQEGALRILPNQATYLARQTFSGPYPKRLYCLPHFFIAGFPKSATTTLADALFKHPRVSSASIKESHWWTRAPIISPSADLLRLNVLRYLMHFGQMAHYATDKPRLLSMDGSQSTLWDSNFVMNGHDFCGTPAAISHVLPQAKFIVMMREPSDRLYSYYLWSCSYKYGNDTTLWPSQVRNDPAGNFHREVVEGVSEFNECLVSSSLYECTNRYTFTNSTKHYDSFCGHIGHRLVVSIYYVHIAKFLQFFPKEQFLFLRMEDMSQESVHFMSRVTDFLQIANYPPSKAKDFLARKVNRQKAIAEPMLEDTRQLLQQFFAPYNRKLSELIGDDRFLWNYS